MSIKKIHLKTSCLTLLAVLMTCLTAWASSHREAPLIADDPLADNTDLYVFRSPDDTNTITIIANYVPMQLPHGGPNYYFFGENVRYEIHVDNDITTAGDDIIYRVTFSYTNEDPSTFFNIRLGNQNLKTSYKLERSMNGGASFTTILNNGVVPAYNVGTRSIEGAAGLDSSYAQIMMNAIKNASTGEKIFCGPVDDPFFVDLGGAFDLGNMPRQGGVPRDGLACYNVSTIAIQIPISTLQKNGKGVGGAANILDGDFVIGVWASASRPQVRTLNGNGTVSDTGDWVQVSRLGMPLTNEVIIPVGQKDQWNRNSPYAEDAAHAEYFYNPELALYIEPGPFSSAVPAFSDLHIQNNSLGMFDFSNGGDGLYGLRGDPATKGTALDTATFGKLLLPAAGKPRSVDLWPIFHTGVPNLQPYQLATGKDAGNPLDTGKPFINNFLPNGGDMLRLNMAVPVTPRQSGNFSSMGLVNAAVLGLTDTSYNADNSLQFIPNMDGFPNGRRLEDDVTRIELQAVSGVALAAIGLWYDDYTVGGNPLTSDLLDVLGYTTGVEHNDTSFRSTFPFLQMPWSGTGKCGGQPKNFTAATILDPTPINCDGDTVYYADMSTENDTICVEGTADYRSFTNTTNTSANYAYIITDDQENILNVVMNGDSVDFDAAGVGECHIYGISYTGELTATPGNPINSVTATGCSDLSTNHLEIMRQDADGGNVAVEDGTAEDSVCLDQGNTIRTYETNTMATGSYQFALTDNTGMILEVSSNGVFDYAGRAESTYRIYGLSYVGVLTANVNSNINTVTGSICFDRSSNFVSVKVEDCGTGISELARKFGVSMNPSPASQFLNIETKVAMKKITVMSVDGRIVLKRYEVSAGTLKWNVEGLQPGIYIVTFANEEGTVMKRFLKN